MRRLRLSAPIALAAFALFAVACGEASEPTPLAPRSPARTPDDAGTRAPATPDSGPAVARPEPTATPDAGAPPAPKPDAGETAPAGWKLTWRDEFDGSAIDTTKWGFDTGAGGWGNNELQYYTDRPENVFVKAGLLNIRAIKEDFTGPKGSAGYTSARLLTRGKFDQLYGRFEAKIKLPHGQGIWPAFWMLGNNLGPTPWPSCGEIDIMENIGKPAEAALSYGTLHGPDQNGQDYFGGAGIGSKYTHTNGRLADDFHTFRAEWQPGVVRFYVDGTQTADKATGTPKDLFKNDLPGGYKWVFDDHAFFMILNLAVGGNWPGAPDGATQFPQTMQVEYVRVYAKDQ